MQGDYQFRSAAEGRNPQQRINDNCSHLIGQAFLRGILILLRLKSHSGLQVALIEGLGATGFELEQLAIELVDLSGHFLDQPKADMGLVFNQGDKLLFAHGQ